MSNAYILTIGDELLIGQTIDTNSAWMGERLQEVGMDVIEKITIPDNEAQIKNALDRAMSKGDVILVTGGLGPTRDDRTKKVLVAYFDMHMEFHQPTYDWIMGLYQKFGKAPADTVHDQSMMPVGAKILHNKTGTAPGMMFMKDGKILISMPGVPREMKYIMETHVLPLIAKTYSGQQILHRHILTAGEGEARISDKIKDIIVDFPPWISIAFLPSINQVKIRLTAKGKDRSVLKTGIEHFAQAIMDRLGTIVYTTKDIPMAEVIQNLAISQCITIGTAESCTGGNIAAELVKIPGSSGYFAGGIIAYSNDVKQNLLHVKRETLQNHGAVSEQTVKEMVHGTLDQLGVDVALAVSGIAGPEGGTPEKPVGTIWIAWGNKTAIHTQLLKGGKDRLTNIEYTTRALLNNMRLYLEGLDQ